MEYLVNAICCYVFSLLLFYIFLIRKNKITKKNKNLNKKKIPVEIEFLTRQFNIKITNKNNNKILYIISLIGSLDITITFLIVMKIKSLILQLLVAFIVVTILILLNVIIFKMISKKGKDKNEQ